MAGDDIRTYARREHDHGEAYESPVAAGTVAHADTTGQTTDDHHAQSHGLVHADHPEVGLTPGHVLRALTGTTYGFGQPLHSDLGSVGADDHHAQQHAIDGVDHTGTLTHSSLTAVTANDHHSQQHAIDGLDHTGNLEHGDLILVGTDDHHAQSHAHNGADGSGTVAHSDLTGVGAADHHSRYTDAEADARAAAAITTHEAAADPHAGYRLESADHTHQSTGAEAGQLDHGLALTGLGDDDHTIYIKADGTRAMTGDFDAGNQDLTNIANIGGSADRVDEVFASALDGNIASSERGTWPATGDATVEPPFIITGSRNDWSQPLFGIWGTHEDHAPNSEIYGGIFVSRGTLASPAAAQAGDEGGLGIFFHDGTDWVHNGGVWFEADNSTPVAGKFPSTAYLTAYADDGAKKDLQWTSRAASGRQSLDGDSDGADDLGRAGLRWRNAYVQRVNFPSTAVPTTDANTLDDYEEGGWTPAITFDTPGDLSVTYSVQDATYQKVGNRVHCRFTVTTSAFTHTTASGALRITGLPFTSVSGGNKRPIGPLTISGYTTTAEWGCLRIVPASTYMNVRMSRSGGGVFGLIASMMPTGGTVDIQGDITYEV